MTTKDKQLLLIDLSARLPHGVNVDIKYSTENGSSLREEICSEGMLQLNTDILGLFQEEEIYLKPYLRPMSSMTEEEREKLSDYLCEQVMSNKIGITIPPNPTQGKGIPFILMGDCLDWLNKHHFDYRDLIGKGLALEAPKDMYNI